MEKTKYVAVSAVSQFAILATLPLITRAYSPADVGDWQYWITILGVVAAVGALRFDVVIHASRSPEEKSRAVKSGVALSILFAPMLSLLLAPLLHGRMNLAAGALLLALASAATALTSIGVASFLADSAVGKARRVVGVQGISTALLQILVSLRPSVAVLLAGAVTLARALAAAVAWRSLSSVRSPFSIFPAGVAALRNAPWAMVATTLLSQAVLATPVLILARLLSDNEFGFASLSWRISVLPMSLFGLVLAQLITASVGQALRERDDHVALIGRWLRRLVVLGGAVGVTLGVFAEFGVSLVFGAQWSQLTVFLFAWLPLGIVQTVASPLSQILPVLGYAKAQLWLDAARLGLVALGALVAATIDLNMIYVVLSMSSAAGIGYLLQVLLVLIIGRRRHRGEAG